jgi:hypothetical protein
MSGDYGFALNELPSEDCLVRNDPHYQFDPKLALDLVYGQFRPQLLVQRHQCSAKSDICRYLGHRNFSTPYHTDLYSDVAHYDTHHTLARNHFWEPHHDEYLVYGIVLASNIHMIVYVLCATRLLWLGASRRNHICIPKVGDHYISLCHGLPQGVRNVARRCQFVSALDRPSLSIETHHESEVKQCSCR